MSYEVFCFYFVTYCQKRNKIKLGFFAEDFNIAFTFIGLWPMKGTRLINQFVFIMMPKNGHHF